VSNEREVAQASRASAFSLMLYSQISLAVMLLICVPLMPRFLFTSNMAGVSNYGVHGRTVVPYTAGILICVWLLLRAAAHLARTGTDRGLARLCRVVAWLHLLNLLSTYPYKIGPTWALVHSICAILLAVAELAGAVILAVLLLRDRAGYVLMALAVGAFVVMALTQMGFLHLLFVGEVITSAAFGVLLVRAVARAP
jgi:hypothetical protein